VARDRLLAVMTLLSRGRFDSADLALAELVCQRLALAIDNANLYQEAEAATRAREELLGIVSHDLRNPLGVVVSAASLLARAAEPDTGIARERAQELARTILRSAQRMERLVGDLLDFARVSAGGLAIEPAMVDAAVLVQESVDACRSAADHKGLRLEVLAARELPVFCDRNRVLQILSNLVDNAIKFTPAAGTVSVRAEDAGEEVHFAVSDSGPGIPEEDLPRIWDRYWRAAKQPGAGLGLGLAIAKSLVEAHGGHIWAESKVGVGTTFHFTLQSSAGQSGGVSFVRPTARRRVA
jgi:signal transduction histidine kinase